jgi:drug/metabolite transporter (DMT)-like permease
VTFHAKDNLRGILLMVASMAGFAMEDMFIKWAAADLPTGEILLLLGVFGGAVFAAMARLQGARTVTRAALHPAINGRNLAEMVGTFGFVTALTLAPLSTVSAVLQAMPLAVTMGAALFLSESVGWRRWSAIVVGFVGVLFVIQPGFDGFDPNALWAVLAVIGLGARDLFTRRIPENVSSVQVSAWGFWAVAVLGVGMVLVTGGARLPDLPQAGYLGGALAFGIAAYWALTQANRLGEMSVITPFRYSRLIFGLLLGIFVFSERPDVMTLFGAVLIIGSGLYTFARERRLRQRTLSLNAAAR